MKRLSLILAVLMIVGTVFGCAANTAAKTTASDAQTAEAFTGKYVVDAQYVLDNLKKEGVLLVDARGEDTAKTGTVQGAIAATWQQFASVSDGAAGDAMWGTILDVARLSEALSQTGISPDKEIILFADAQKGWGRGWTHPLGTGCRWLPEREDGQRRIRRAGCRGNPDDDRTRCLHTGGRNDFSHRRNACNQYRRAGSRLCGLQGGRRPYGKGI